MSEANLDIKFECKYSDDSSFVSHTEYPNLIKLDENRVRDLLEIPIQKHYGFIFKSVKMIHKPPSGKQSFYLKLPMTNQLCQYAQYNNDYSQREHDPRLSLSDFKPYDDSQLWQFLEYKSGYGFLIHKKTQKFLTYENRKLEWWPLESYYIKDQDVWTYNDNHEWVHVASGCKLCYYDTIDSKQYKFEIIAKSDILDALRNHSIEWEN